VELENDRSISFFDLLLRVVDNRIIAWSYKKIFYVILYAIKLEPFIAWWIEWSCCLIQCSSRRKLNCVSIYFLTMAILWIWYLRRLIYV